MQKTDASAPLLICGYLPYASPFFATPVYCSAAAPLMYSGVNVQRNHTILLHSAWFWQVFAPFSLVIRQQLSKP